MTDTTAAALARPDDERRAHDLPSVAHRTVDSPVGPLLLAATPAGLVRIAFGREDHDLVLDRLLGEVGRFGQVGGADRRTERSPRRLDEAARQLDAYFTGRRRTFDLPLDLRLAHGFRRTVLTHLRDVVYGTTTTYAALAARTGRPGAGRAVGSACATNPLPVVVPCHRVVRSDGVVGEYLGGTEAKRALLALEAA